VVKARGGVDVAGGIWRPYRRRIVQRWGCRIGEFPYANDECWMREDGLYVYVHPSVEPVPLASAAEHHEVGMLVLAVAVLLFPWVLTGRWPGDADHRVPVVAAGVAASALPTFLSSLEGEAVSLPDMWLAEVLLLLDCRRCSSPGCASRAWSTTERGGTLGGRVLPVCSPPT
jgi:hypothetical protein